MCNFCKKKDDLHCFANLVSFFFVLRPASGFRREAAKTRASTMSLSGSTDVRNEQTKLNENEQLNPDDERFNGGNSTNENSFKAASLTAIDSNSKVVDLSPSSKNVDLLDNSDKAAFSLARLSEQQMVHGNTSFPHGTVDQNNNEYFSAGSYAPLRAYTDQFLIQSSLSP